MVVRGIPHAAAGDRGWVRILHRAEHIPCQCAARCRHPGPYGRYCRRTVTAGPEDPSCQAQCLPSCIRLCRGSAGYLECSDRLLVTGTPQWSNAAGGNHDWVEIWDQGVWSFTGPTEYTTKVCVKQSAALCITKPCNAWLLEMNEQYHGCYAVVISHVCFGCWRTWRSCAITKTRTRDLLGGDLFCDDHREIAHLPLEKAAAKICAGK